MKQQMFSYGWQMNFSLQAHARGKVTPNYIPASQPSNAHIISLPDPLVRQEEDDNLPPSAYANVQAKHRQAASLNTTTWSPP